jgi:hypothetical protein
MLKVNEIVFKDKKDRSYIISGRQIETFPLIGGEEAEIITTKIWNQHGNTHINSLMDVYEGELIFAIYTSNMRSDQIEEARRNLTNICNPLNGTIRMTVTLNNGSIYHRDITFLSAPLFPTGLENRNYDWQKVQLMYTANNPFWYSEIEIVESFQGSEPLFTFPFSNEVVKPNLIPITTFADLTQFTDWYNVMTFASEENNSVLVATMADFATNPRMRLVQGNANRTNFVAGESYIFSFKIKPDATLKELEYLDYVAYNPDATFEWINYSSKIILDTLQADEDGYYHLSFKITADRTGEVRFGLGFGGFINLEMANGSAFRIKDLQIAEQSTTGYVQPTIIFGEIIPANSALNAGQAEAPVVIEIKGACVNPSITNETTGEFIAFRDLTMTAGQTLIIDTTFGQKKVELDGENVFNKLDFNSTFFNLTIGENIIDFSDETGNPDATINFIYKNLYVTI